MDLDALIARLRETIARHGLPVVVHLVYPDGRTELLTLPTDSMPGTGLFHPEDSEAPDLSDREKAALAVLQRADQPMKGRTVATRAGIRYTSHFRELMSGLVRKGLVRTTPDRRYWLAERPLPPERD